MKDEYLKAYQQRIEEIKALDVSPEEKRKLAADAKNEILDQYKSSYIKEKEVAAQQEAQIATNNDEDKILQTAAETVETPNEETRIEADEAKDEIVPGNVESNEDTIETPASEADDIDNILNKLEEREERGEVGIELDTPTAFMNPDDLFSTMNLDDLFASLGIEDEDFEDEEIDDESEIQADLDEMFMDSEALFAGLLDEVEDEVEADDILNEFDLNEDTKPLEPNPILGAETVEVFNSLNEEQPEEAEEQEVEVDQVEGDTQVVSSVETDVDEVEELTEGTIVDEETDVTEELDSDSVNELEELEKERERAQKLGAIEMALLVVLIVLVIIVVYLIIGV